jgi:hypothetical protein
VLKTFINVTSSPAVHSPGYFGLAVYFRAFVLAFFAGVENGPNSVHHIWSYDKAYANDAQSNLQNILLCRRGALTCNEYIIAAQLAQR